MLNIHVHAYTWAPAGGGQEGAHAPPLEIQKYGGPPQG